MLIVVTGASPDLDRLEKSLQLPLSVATWYTYGRNGTELNIQGSVSKKAQTAIKAAYKRNEVASVDIF